MSLAVAPAAGLSVQSRPPTILVVDHRESIRRVLALILESEGYQVVIAETASAAPLLAQEILPQALVMSLTASDMSGLSALQNIRFDERTRTLPVILLTERGATLSQNDRAQATYILQKPLDLDVLVLRVGQLVGQPA